MVRVFVLALGVVVALASPAWAQQAVTRGSTLAPPANVPFGCEASVELPPLGLSDFALAPTGKPSCTWWSSGVSSEIAGTNTGFVPTTGTVTNVRVKSGPNPAPLRLVHLRSTAGCCTIVRHTEPFQPVPNAVTQVTVNWLVEVVRDSVVGVSTNDIIGFSAVGGAGTLPLNDQGPGTHTPQAAFGAGIHSGTMTAPAAQPGALLGGNYRSAIGYEPLVQYDFVPCPALNNVPVAPGTINCPVQATVTTGGANAPPVAFPTSGVPFSGGFVLPVTVLCSLDIGCSGQLRLAIATGAVRSAATVRSLGTTRFTVAKGRHQVRLKLSKKARSTLRRKKATKVVATLTVAGQPAVRKTLTVRR